MFGKSCRALFVIILSFAVLLADAFMAKGNDIEMSDEVSIIVGSFNVHFGSPLNQEDILDDSLDNDYFNNWENSPANSIIDIETGLVKRFTQNKESLIIADAEILCSDELMRKYLKENGVTNINSIIIFSGYYFTNGFFVRIETNSGICFAVFLVGRDEQSGFKNRGIYTFEEFRELCIPSQVKLIIDGVEIDCEKPPIIKFGRTLVPLRATFEALGFDVQWSDDTRTAVFSKEDDTYEFRFNTGASTDSLFVNGKGLTMATTDDNGLIMIYDESYATIKDGRIMIEEGFMFRLASMCGFTIDYDLYTNVVTIDKI